MCAVAYEDLIIGTGQAGPPLAARLSAAGRRVAIIERGAFGGTCVNNGCTPTKAMVASAYAAHLARRAADYGVDAGPVRVDMRQVKARKDAIVTRSRQGVEHWMRALERATVYQGQARFTAARTVEVGADRLTAERVFIDVGGRPLVPEMPGLNEVPFLTNIDMMAVDELPEHLIVIGGSYIGLEFGQMFRRFGSRVTIVEMQPRLIGREDPDVCDAVQGILEAEGIDIRLNAKCVEVARDNGAGIAVKLDCAHGTPRVIGTHLLLAVGRVPNTDDLGLEQAGIAVDERGYIRVDDTLRTTAEGVYALGDCNGRGAFTHTAYNDYEIVADNLLRGTHRKVSDRVPIYALFIDPPLGRVGMTQSEAERGGLKVLTAKRPMTRVARAVEKGETQGFMKIVVELDSRRVLGAAILGPGGDEVVHSLVDAIYARTPIDAVQHTVRIHPTVSELIPTVLAELAPPV
ncbi:MAG TPA: FAD-containing oxidoreductase [Burkholderiales bacterium]|nr:FAD-containing oxidoreductase [Burkholderiales bacterium]